MYIKIEAKEKLNYIWRNVVVAIFVIVLFGILIALGPRRYWNISWNKNAIITVVAFVLVFYFSNDPLGTRYFILCFEINNDQVYLSFRDKMNSQEIKGRKSDFEAIKDKGRFGRYASPPFLEIKYKGKRVVKQYYHRGVSKQKIDEIVSCLA